MSLRNSRGFLPTTDSGLLTWSANFNQLISATPTTYGLTTVQASAYIAANDSYATALQTARDPGTRTRPSVAAKDAAREKLKTLARLYAKIVDATPSVTDAQKLSLGLTIRKRPTPIPAPGMSPIVEVLSVNGRAVMVRLHSDEPSRRGRPSEVAGAKIDSFVGENPSDDIEDWRYEDSTTKMVYEVTFAASVVPGTRVWIAAVWYNPKAEDGPLSQPTNAVIGYGMSAAA